MRQFITCRDWYENEAKIYGVTQDSNALFEINKDTEEVRVIALGLAEKLSNGIFAHLYSNGKVIVFAPFSANYILIYDLLSEKTKRLDIEIIEDDSIGLYNDDMKFWEITSFDEGKSVYIFGRKYPAVIHLDLNTLEMEYLCEWKEKIPTRYLEKITSDSLYFGNGVAIVDDYAYMASGIGSGIWKIDYNNNSFDYIDLELDVDGFFSISSCVGGLILSEIGISSDNLFLWNPSDKSIKRIPLSKKYYWSRPTIYNNQAYVFSWMCNGHMLKINCDTWEYKRLYELENELMMENGDVDFALSIKENEGIIKFVSAVDGYWYSYSIEDGSISKKKYLFSEKDFCLLKDDYYRQIYNSSVESGRILYESDIPLKKFIELA